MEMLISECNGADMMAADFLLKFHRFFLKESFLSKLICALKNPKRHCVVSTSPGFVVSNVGDIPVWRAPKVKFSQKTGFCEYRMQILVPLIEISKKNLNQTNIKIKNVLKELIVSKVLNHNNL